MSINALNLKKYRDQIVEAKRVLHIINFTANAKKTVDMVKQARDAKKMIAKMQIKISKEIKGVA